MPDTFSLPASASQPGLTCVGEGALLGLFGDWRPAAYAALPLAERVRAALMREAGRDIPWQISGKDPAGRPRKGHDHLYILPLERRQNQGLDRVLVWGAQGLQPDTCRVLENLGARGGTIGWKGRTRLRLELLALGSHDELMRESCTRPYLAPASVWDSRSSFVAPRFPKQRGARQLDQPEEQLRRLLKLIYGLVPDQVLPLEGEWAAFEQRRAKRRDGPRRPASGWRLRFPTPVPGPLVLGYGAHFGLGVFEAHTSLTSRSPVSGDRSPHHINPSGQRMSKRKKHKKKKKGKGRDARRSSHAPAQASPSRPSWFDPRPTRTQVERALRAAGSSPQLIGFEAVGIQEFLAANSRPVALDGASRLIKEGFDAHNHSNEACVFAGGGRGLMVVAKSQVDTVVQALETRYRNITHGGQLAIAHVPLDLQTQRASLRWLRLKLDGAKDCARAPTVPLPEAANAICKDCNLRAAQTHYLGPDQGRPVPACERCAKVVEVGRQLQGARWTFEEIAVNGALALVYADGNNLGALFAELASLEEHALCSEIVAKLFATAHADASPEQLPFLDPVLGGDDIRVFLPPHALLPYVTTLTRRIHELTTQLDERELPRSIVRTLQRVGVGVGAIVAPYHYPARRLWQMAHDLEDEAKKVCAQLDYRSALSFVVLRSGEELSQGVAAYTHQGGSPNVIELGTKAAARHLERALALREVSSSQRAAMVSAREELEDEAEFLNAFCYQVARHAGWRSWYEACEVDWRDREALSSNLPSRALLDLASLMEGAP